MTITTAEPAGHSKFNLASRFKMEFNIEMEEMHTKFSWTGDQIKFKIELARIYTGR